METREVHIRHAVQQAGESRRPIAELPSALRNRLKTYWESGDEHADFVTFLLSEKELVTAKVRENLEDSPFKINFLVKAEFAKGETVTERTFKTANVRVFITDDLAEVVETAFGKLLREKSEHESKVSGWLRSD
jgi:hypothetical protein